MLTEAGIIISARESSGIETFRKLHNVNSISSNVVL